MIKKTVILRVLRIGLALLLAVLFFSACQSRTRPNSTPTTNRDLVGTIVAATLTAFPSATPAWTPTPTYQTYSNEAYGFAFDYPPDWDLTETNVPSGTLLSGRSHGRYNIGGGVLLVDLAKGTDWILEFVANKAPASACPGGQGPLPDDPIYQPLEILGRKAARYRPEDGQAWNPPEVRELATLPVMFYKLPGECNQDWPENSIPSRDIVFLWGYTDPQTLFSIDMTYYSNQFTTSNLQNRTIDYAVIHEMDQIVQSLRLLAQK